MGGTTILLVKLSSMEVSNQFDFLKYGVVNFRIFSMLGLTLRPKGVSLVTMVILVPVPLVLVLSL